MFSLFQKFFVIIVAWSFSSEMGFPVRTFGCNYGDVLSTLSILIGTFSLRKNYIGVFFFVSFCCWYVTIFSVISVQSFYPLCVFFFFFLLVFHLVFFYFPYVIPEQQSPLSLYRLDLQSLPTELLWLELSK